MSRPAFPIPWSLTGAIADHLAAHWVPGTGRAVLVTGGLGDGGLARALAGSVPGAVHLNPMDSGGRGGRRVVPLLDALLAVERHPLVVCEVRSHTRPAEAAAWTGVCQAARAAGSVFLAVWYGTTMFPQASAEDEALVRAYRAASDLELECGACLYPYEATRGRREGRQLGRYASPALSRLAPLVERWPRSEEAYLRRAMPRLRRALWGAS